MLKSPLIAQNIIQTSRLVSPMQKLILPQHSRSGFALGHVWPNSHMELLGTSMTNKG